MRHIFHLSIPVADLDEARQFYEQTLGGRPGRIEKDWADILIWGHQVTLKHRPDEVLGPDSQGTRHFGVVLPWNEWTALAERLEASGCTLLAPAKVTNEATRRGQAKLYLEDPSHNVIELKAYRDFAYVLGTDDENYGSFLDDPT